MRPETSVPTGYVLAETDDVAIIATLHSENVKTGDMVQIWILCRNESPVEAVRNSNRGVAPWLLTQQHGVV